MTAPVTIISFGYGHCRWLPGQRTPVAHVTYDLRYHFRDPHVTPALRDLTGLHATIESIVLGTPGILVLVDAITVAARGFLGGPQPGEVTIAIGCAGGRHRSVAVAGEVARRLAADNIPVTVRHRHITRPVSSRRVAAGLGRQDPRAASLRACGLQPWRFGVTPVPRRVRLWHAATRWRAPS